MPSKYCNPGNQKISAFLVLFVTAVIKLNPVLGTIEDPIVIFCLIYVKCIV